MKFSFIRLFQLVLANSRGKDRRYIVDTLRRGGHVQYSMIGSDVIEEYTRPMRDDAKLYQLRKERYWRAYHKALGGYSEWEMQDICVREFVYNAAKSASRYVEMYENGDDFIAFTDEGLALLKKYIPELAR